MQLRVPPLDIEILTGKSRGIADTTKRKKINAICLQETWWTGDKLGRKIRTIGGGY